MNAGRTILFLVLEGNVGNKGNIQDKYNDGRISFNYEEEAIHCVRSWFKFGPEDIKDIYCVCVNNNPPSKNTITSLTDLGVKYFHWPQDEADSYKCGYWNVPLAGMLLEDKLDSMDNILHIDLDMSLFRPFEIDHIKPLGSKARIAINEFRPTEQKGVGEISPIYKFEINTGFIYSSVSGRFYKDWYERLKLKTKSLLDTDPSYSIWEERICDVMYFEEGYDFEFFEPFQINGPLDSYNDDQISKICFNHCHLEHEQRRINQLEDYLKRCR